jgi:hypothetical protein
LEDLPADNKSERHAKTLMDDAISRSEYLAELTANQREMKARWKLAFLINLDKIKERCPKGYDEFIKELQRVITSMV